MRLLTWLIHIDMVGVGDVKAGGVHIHHYVWGFLLLAAVGAAGLVTERLGPAPGWGSPAGSVWPWSSTRQRC